MSTFTATSGVYALVDPRTERVMYIGQSIDIDRRYRQHVDPRSNEPSPAKARWLDGLRREGLSPRLVILRQCGVADADCVERDMIREYKARGECELNRAVGGRECRAVSKALNAHPDDWLQVGLDLRRARRLIQVAIIAAGKVAGVSVAERGDSILSAIGRFQELLADRMAKAQPDRRDVLDVFYGPDPDEVSAEGR